MDVSIYRDGTLVQTDPCGDEELRLTKMSDHRFVVYPWSSYIPQSQIDLSKGVLKQNPGY